MDDHKPPTHDPLEYDRQDTITLDIPLVLTQDKNLISGMPYLYSEGSYSAAVRLLGVWVENGIVYLHVEELQSQRSFTVNWNLDYYCSYYLWTIADLPTIINLST